MTERDENLGAAIRALPVPEHGERFWPEFEQMLAAEPRQLRPRRRLLVPLAAVAAVILVVAGVAVVASRGTERATGVAAGGPTVPPMVSGIMKVDINDGQTKHSDTQRFAEAVDGSWSMELADGSRQSFDAATRRHVVAQQEGSGSGQIGWFLRTDVEPGVFGVLSLGILDSAAARSEGVPGTPINFLGREAHRFDRDGELTAFTGSPADHTSTVVDDETGLLLSRTDTRAGTVVSTVEVTEFTSHDQIERSAFVLDPPPGARVLHDTDEGTRVVGLEELGDVVGYALDAPKRLLGRELVSVTARPGKPGPASGLASQGEEGRTVLTYRRGYDIITVTTHRAGEEDTAAVDPLVQGAPVTGTVVSDPAGDIHVVKSGPVRAPPHAWTTKDGIVVAVSGALSPDELVEAIRAITPSG